MLASLADSHPWREFLRWERRSCFRVASSFFFAFAPDFRAILTRSRRLELLCPEQSHALMFALSFLAFASF